MNITSQIQQYTEANNLNAENPKNDPIAQHEKHQFVLGCLPNEMHAGVTAWMYESCIAMSCAKYKSPPNKHIANDPRV
jgi:hypothetical protein